jgi:general L-amino acid transport system substrate-binding protein
MKKAIIGGAIACAAVGLPALTASAGTLDDVRAADVLRCGVSTGIPGFSAADAEGKWHGLDVDTCRSVAAAVLGDANKVQFVPLTAQNRFSALTAGEVDMLSRVTTWTLTRDADLAVEFTGVNYYDGQGFLVAKDLGVTSALELDGATICIQTGTTSELNLSDFFRAKGMSYEPVPVADGAEAMAQFRSGACDVNTGDSSALAAQRTTLPDPASAMVLPELISKEPLGPLVRHGDNAWGDVVRWSLNALIVADELGLTAETAAKLAETGSDNPEVNRVLGREGNLGEKLGLEADWAFNIITQVGSYGEVFDRHVGPETLIGLERGLNAQWTEGGMLYAPPFR